MQRTERLMRRSRQNGGMWLGLCAGIGAHLGVDPLLVRLVCVTLTLLSAGGLMVPLLYVVFGLIVPAEREAA